MKKGARGDLLANATAAASKSPCIPLFQSGNRGRSETRPGDRGFTLLEISLVILIISIVLSIAIPRLGDRSRSELRSHVNRLRTTFRFVRNEAILSGRTYRLNYDLDQHRYWVTSEGAADIGESDTSILMRPVKLPDTVAFSDIVLQSAGKLAQGRLYTRFFPDGFVDPTVVHMDNGREAYTLSVWPLTGQVSVYEGYRDIEILG